MSINTMAQIHAPIVKIEIDHSEGYSYRSQSDTAGSRMAATHEATDTPTNRDNNNCSGLKTHRIKFVSNLSKVEVVIPVSKEQLLGEKEIQDSPGMLQEALQIFFTDDANAAQLTNAIRILHQFGSDIIMQMLVAHQQENKESEELTLLLSVVNPYATERSEKQIPKAWVKVFNHTNPISLENILSALVSPKLSLALDTRISLAVQLYIHCQIIEEYDPTNWLQQMEVIQQENFTELHYWMLTQYNKKNPDSTLQPGQSHHNELLYINNQQNLQLAAAQRKDNEEGRTEAHHYQQTLDLLITKNLKEGYQETLDFLLQDVQDTQKIEQDKIIKHFNTLMKIVKEKVTGSTQVISSTAQKTIDKAIATLPFQLPLKTEEKQSDAIQSIWSDILSLSSKETGAYNRLKAFHTLESLGIPVNLNESKKSIEETTHYQQKYYQYRPANLIKFLNYLQQKSDTPLTLDREQFRNLTLYAITSSKNETTITENLNILSKFNPDNTDRQNEFWRRDVPLHALAHYNLPALRYLHTIQATDFQCFLKYQPMSEVTPGYPIGEAIKNCPSIYDQECAAILQFLHKEVHLSINSTSPSEQHSTPLEIAARREIRTDNTGNSPTKKKKLIHELALEVIAQTHENLNTGITLHLLCTMQGGLKSVQILITEARNAQLDLGTFLNKKAIIEMGKKLASPIEIALNNEHYAIANYLASQPETTVSSEMKRKLDKGLQQSRSNLNSNTKHQRRSSSPLSRIKNLLNYF